MELRTDLVNQTSPAQAKVALFRSLFRGREDVYRHRFESRKTGKAGYAPACANEWVRGICEKPRIRVSPEGSLWTPSASGTEDPPQPPLEARAFRARA